MGWLSKRVYLQLIVGLSFVFGSVNSSAQQCSQLFSSNKNSRPSLNKPQVSKSQLKIGTYNLLNLYIHKGNIRKDTDPHEKPRWAIEEMGLVLKAENYDIFVAQEVESIQSAHRFNKEHLDNQYNIYSTTTKDIRGLFVIFFVKKTLPFTFKIESHADEMWFDPLNNSMNHVYERDLPTLHIYKNTSDNIPMLTMMGVHFKSKRDRFGPKDLETQHFETEKESTRLREAQANRATELIQKYQIEFGYEHPIIIAGDFNNNHNYAPEYAGFFRHAKLADTLGMASPVTQFSQRATHSYFGDTKPRHQQLDGILVTTSLVGSLMQSYVVNYRDENGIEKDIPRTKQERKRNPSDHRPVTAIFNLEQIISN